MSRPRKIPRLQLRCFNCGTEYERPGSAKTGLKYCSTKCFHIAQVGMPKPKRMRWDTHECHLCGVSFKVGGRGNRQRNAKYCSIKCHASAYTKHAPVRDMTLEEIAWLSGLFDGEGNIGWSRPRNVHSFRLSISNTSMELLNKIVSVTGTGSIIVKKSKNPKHSDSANWTVQGDRAKIILVLMMPWLIVKRENGQIALEAVDAKERGLPPPRMPVSPRSSVIRFDEL